MSENISQNINESRDINDNLVIDHQKHRNAMDSIADLIIVPHKDFNPAYVFNKITEYLLEYKRILYTPLANFIYGYRQEHEDYDEDKIIGNLEVLLSYIESEEYKSLRSNATEEERKKYDATCRAILKIWDHTSLALAQFTVMNRTDKDYNQRIENFFALQKAEVEKEMQQKMLTMISIFTALAFLLFGGISSLDNVFFVKDMPLFKVMISALTWGLCFVNMISLFLYFTGKLTNTSFKSTDKADATVFEKYPIVFWSNFTILVLIIFLSWIYYLLSNNLLDWLVEIINTNTFIFVTLITAAIIMAITRVGVLLINKTKLNIGGNNKKEDENQKK